MGGLPSVIADSFKGAPDFYKWAFRGEALKNYGELNGKAALAGLGIAGLIAGTVLGGPLGFAAALPGAIKGSLSFAGGVKDLIDNKDLNSDMNETERKVMSSDAGQVLNGLDAASSFIGGLSGISKGVQNLSNIASRGSGRAAIGEILKIVGPGIKDAFKLSGSVGEGARTLTHLASLREATGRSIPATQGTAMTEIRPGQEGRAIGAIKPPTFGRSAIPPPSYLGPIK